MGDTEDGDVTWEVAVAKGLHARVPVARDVGSRDTASHVAAILNSGGAAIVSRTDATPEALRKKWEDDFYDIDRAGRRRRRFRKTPIEREWEEFYANRKRSARSDRSLDKAGNIGCPDCSATWSRHAPETYVHQCKREDG